MRDRFSAPVFIDDVLHCYSKVALDAPGEGNFFYPMDILLARK
jgi:hypothetical protein